MLHASFSMWNTMDLNSNIFLKPRCYNSAAYMIKASFQKSENSTKASFKKAENSAKQILWICMILWMFNSVNTMVVKCWSMWSSLDHCAFGHNCSLAAARQTKTPSWPRCTIPGESNRTKHLLIKTHIWPRCTSQGEANRTKHLLIKTPSWPRCTSQGETNRTKHLLIKTPSWPRCTDQCESNRTKHIDKDP